MRTLIRFELQKIFSRRLTLAALAAVLLLSALFSFSTYQNMYAFDGISREGTGRDAVEIDQSIAAKFEGVLTDEKVQQMMDAFAPKTDLHGMNAVYLYQNAMQSAALARFSDIDGNWNGLRVSDVFGSEELKIGYVNGWLSTSQNMVRVFVVLTFAIAVMAAPVFSSEYGGVDTIILTSKYGKTKCATAKVFSCLLAALLVTGATAVINLLAAFVMYGPDGLDCSILFAPLSFLEGYIPFNLTCGTLLRYQALLAFTGAVSAASITLILSAACKSQMAAITASAAICVLPLVLPVSETSPLFRLIVLSPLHHSLFVPIMSVAQMGNGLLYAVWAVPAALLLLAAGCFVSRRIFARHQVS